MVPQFDIPGITSNDTGSTNISSADQLLSINDAGTIVGTSPTQGGFEVNPAPVDTIDNGGTLYVAQPSNDTVKFAGNTGTLVLDDLTDFHGQIQNFTGTAPDAAHSDVIDLAGVNFNSASFSESYNISTGVLTVSDGTDTGSLSFANFNGTFKFASDGHGGTDISTRRLRITPARRCRSATIISTSTPSSAPGATMPARKATMPRMITSPGRIAKNGQH